MKTAVLKIYSDIGVSSPDMFGMSESSFSSKDVIDFLEANSDSTEITVKINSRGGDVQEGWAIYDQLVNSGKKIKTIGEGKVYSIATIIFLAGDERLMMKNADGLIHNPYIPAYTLADAYESSDLIKIAEGLAQEEEKILNFYAERTGCDKSKLAEYMKEDTMLSAEDMVTLGFATGIIEPVKAYAYLKPNFNNMTEKEVKTWGEKLDAILAKIQAFTRLPVTAQVLTDKDGKELKLEKESGDPAVGDMASPDGVFMLTNGLKVTVAGGQVTECVTETVETELDKANAKIAELEAKVAQAETDKVAAEALKAEAEALKAESETAKAEAETVKASFTVQETEAKALVEELRGLKNSWKPDGRDQHASGNKVDGIDLGRVQETLNKIKS